MLLYKLQTHNITILPIEHLSFKDNFNMLCEFAFLRQPLSFNMQYYFINIVEKLTP